MLSGKLAGGRGWPVLSRRLLWIVGLGLLATLFVWWRAASSDPRRVFEGMLGGRLKLGGTSSQTLQAGGGQQLSQQTRLVTGPYNAARSVSTLQIEQPQPASITTETIGTPTADYIRYLFISAGRGSSGYNDLINTWGRSEGANGLTNGQLYNQAVLGAVPAANLPASLRQPLLKRLIDGDIYTIDYSATNRILKSGRPTYVYQANLHPGAYVRFLKDFGVATGLNQLANVDAERFAQAPPIALKIGVDVWSRNLVFLDFAGADRRQQYGGFGNRTPIRPPAVSVPLEQLQQKVQSLQ